MFNLIVAMTQNKGIGINNQLPWKIPEELKLFSTITQNSVLIVGRKTAEHLPELKNRVVLTVSTKFIGQYVFDSFERALSYAHQRRPRKEIYIIGGSVLYNHVLEHHKHQLNRLYVSVINKEYECDSYIKLNMNEFVIDSMTTHADFTHYVLLNKQTSEHQYLKLLSNVHSSGKIKHGRNGITISSFVNHLSFDLRNGFPLLTTKKMFWKGIVEELLFFIRGDTDTKLLEQQNINIWQKNTSREFLDMNNKQHLKEGDMGPMYGYQWRNFNGSGYDQLSNLISDIKTDPTSRRLLLTTYNPIQAKDGVLYPCHSLMSQFNVDAGCLDMYCFNRSSDLFLGLPFNIASSSLLLMIIAKLCNLTPRYFNLSLGDCHIYDVHMTNVETQLNRACYSLPTVILPNVNTLQDVETLTYESFILVDYNSHPAIKAEMVA